MPARPIHDDNAVGFGGDGGADLLKVLLHGLGVGAGHHQGRPFVEGRANRAKDIGVRVALVGWLARACAFWRPLINLAILLANPRFILEPDFNGRILRDIFQAFRQRLWEVFLKASIASGSCLGCWGRTLTCEKPRR